MRSTILSNFLDRKTIAHILVTLCCIGNCAFGQVGVEKEKTARVGLAKGIASPRLFNLDYGYDVSLNVIHFSQTIFTKHNTLRSEWRGVLLPQYNVVRILDPSSQESFEKTGFELGINIGIMRVWKNRVFGLNLYTLLSIGPHYLSEHSYRQAKGFLFSDNLAIGMLAPLSSSWNIDAQVGYRHISNANLDYPNGGYNTLQFQIAILHAL